MTWLADNWLTIVGVLLYVLDRFPEIERQWKNRVALLADVIEREDKLSPEAPVTAKTMLPTHARGDMLLDMVLDNTQPKEKARVSRRRKLGRFLLNMIPLFSRLGR